MTSASAFSGSIYCWAGCGSTHPSRSSLASTDDDTVQDLRQAGWQVVNGDWTCPNDLPAERRGLPAAMGRRANPHCTTCGDTRGGPYGHEAYECTWAPA